MVRRFCDKCGADITYYKDFIVKMNVETISNKVEYLEQGDQSFDLCSNCKKEVQDDYEKCSLKYCPYCGKRMSGDVNGIKRC